MSRSFIGTEHVRNTRETVRSQSRKTSDTGAKQTRSRWPAELNNTGSINEKMVRDEVLKFLAVARRNGEAISLVPVLAIYKNLIYKPSDLQQFAGRSLQAVAINISAKKLPPACNTL